MKNLHELILFIKAEKEKAKKYRKFNSERRNERGENISEGKQIAFSLILKEAEFLLKN